MNDILTMHLARTEHARLVRRLTGTNDFRDKEIHFTQFGYIPCIGTELVDDNNIILIQDE